LFVVAVPIYIFSEDSIIIGRTLKR